MRKSVPNNFSGFTFLSTNIVGRGDKLGLRYKISVEVTITKCITTTPPTKCITTTPFTLAINVTDALFGTTLVLEKRRKFSELSYERISLGDFTIDELYQQECLIVLPKVS